MYHDEYLTKLICYIFKYVWLAFRLVVFFSSFKYVYGDQCCYDNDRISYRLAGKRKFKKNKWTILIRKYIIQIPIKSAKTRLKFYFKTFFTDLTIEEIGKLKIWKMILGAIIVLDDNTTQIGLVLKWQWTQIDQKTRNWNDWLCLKEKWNGPIIVINLPSIEIISSWMLRSILYFMIQPKKTKQIY